MKLPDCSFFLFGMGNRPKMLYQDGKIWDALSAKVIRGWDVRRATIRPAEYRVDLVCGDGGRVTVFEDEAGVWVAEHDTREQLAAGAVRLPSFADAKDAAVLRILHHEILVNIMDGRPVPNFLVYRKPWYRDAAMMAMCLEKTGNLHLVRDWIMGLREPFDRNNAGHEEPDNLGQALYLISLVSDAGHPLPAMILDAVRPFRRDRFISGLSDFAAHPVYQTKWLKFGLARLGLPDPYEIPAVYDSYSALFWMDYRDAHVAGPHFSDEDRDLYPYLGWAEAHFHGWQPPWRSDREARGATYPLTWEAEASQADYQGMKRIAPEYAVRKIAAPHTWHAAEMFLYLLER